MGKSKRNKGRRRDQWLDDPIALANAEVAAAERTLLAKRQAAARAAAAMVNGQAPSPEEQYAEFLNRPGDYYVCTFNVGGKVNETQGVTYVAECVLKADEVQLPYLIEVIRQIRGGFGEQARISLARARTTQQAPAPRHDDPRPGVASAAARFDPRPTPATEALHRLHAEHAARVDAFERQAADLLPEDMQPDLTREQLQEQLPGMTRAEVADELGLDPAAIGGDIKHAGALDVEQLAAELGVSPLDLMPIKATDGSTVYAVKPGAAVPRAGRHAAPEDDSRDDSGRGA